MKKILLTATVLAAIVGGGFAVAQTLDPKVDDHAAHHPDKAAAAAPAGGQTGAGPAMGGGMMGMMGGGMCPMMGDAGTKVEVKKIDKGVTITMTSSDAATVTRLQKMAEAMRLMHEAMGQ